MSGPHLTPREKEVLESLTKGLEDAKIATRLSIAKSTVRAHISSIFTKLGVENRTAAACEYLKRRQAQSTAGP